MAMAVSFSGTVRLLVADFSLPTFTSRPGSLVSHLAAKLLSRHALGEGLGVPINVAVEEAQQFPRPQAVLSMRM